MISEMYLPKAHAMYLSSVTSRYLVDVREIIRIQSISNYSKLFFSSGKTMVVARVLCRFEEELHTRDFMRVHRTHLINTDYISQYRSGNGGDKLQLMNGEVIDISRRKAGFLKLLRDRFIGSPKHHSLI